MRRAVYAGIQKTADVLWGVARAVDRRFPERSFKPKWAPAPLLKQREKTFPPLGFPRQTDSLCPRCVTEVRTQILSGDVDWKVLIEGNPGEIKASIVEEDGKILMRKDCPKHGRFEDVMSTDPEFFRSARVALPGPRLRPPEGRPARARDLVHQVRARSGADDRPDEPLQHDVQPVLHGRQPGRVRPRARVGRGPEAPRRRGLDQAAPAALRPVLRRRAHALAALPAGRPVRPPARVLLGAVRHQRHPLRPGRELREGGGRGGAALRVPPVRRRRQRAQRAPQGRQPLRRQAARDREPPQARRRRHARGDDRQRDQQRPGRRHHPLRPGEHRQGHLRRVPARVLHRARRGHRRRDAQEAALHAVAPRPRREDAGRDRRADARLVPAVGGGSVLRPEGPAGGPRVRVGLLQVRLPPQLRHRHADARGREDPARGDGARPS